MATSVTAELVGEQEPVTLALSSDGLSITHATGKVTAIPIADVTGLGFSAINSSTMILPLPVKIPSGSKRTLEVVTKSGRWAFHLSKAVLHSSDAYETLAGIYAHIAKVTFEARLWEYMKQLKDAAKKAFEFEGITFSLKDHELRQGTNRVGLGAYFILRDGSLLVFKTKRFFGERVCVPLSKPNADVVVEILHRIWKVPRLQDVPSA